MGGGRRRVACATHCEGSIDSCVSLLDAMVFATTTTCGVGATSRVMRATRHTTSRTVARATKHHRVRCADGDVADATSVVSRRAAMTGAVTAWAALRAPDARAEYGDTLYMQGLQGQGKDYGKSTIIYPDFTQTASGLQYTDVVEAPAGAATYDGASSGTAVIDWDGYTIGYYGRPVRVCES